MVTLSLLEPQALTPQQQWNFESESTIRIGRSPDNDVVLNDSLVSRHHAQLQRVGNSNSNSSWQLVNQGTNGTFVDGILVSQGLLSNDSLIQLARGGPMLKFQLATGQHRPQAGVSPQPQRTNPPHPPDATEREYPTPGPRWARGDVGQQGINSNRQESCTHSGNPPNNLFCIHCGQPIVQVQRFIRQYQVLRTLGQGGMGTTYLAWDKVGTINGRSQLLVLKEMNADMAQISKAQELFEREARILKGLHHPGIPTYYDFFVEGGKKYLAMELIHGQDLEKRIYLRGPCTPPQAIAWMIQTCDVLDYIHQQEPPLIHRDIKPANLLVRTVDNRVVVLDFGAVKEIGTALGTRIGAEGYSAPEQDRGQPCTQSDLYAIGPTLIFLLTGDNPMKFYRKRGSGYRFDVESIPTVTPQLRSAIERVTEPKPRDRYQSAKELSLALADCL